MVCREAILRRRPSPRRSLAGTPGVRRRWLTAAPGAEVVALVMLAVLAGTGVLSYQGIGRLILIITMCAGAVVGATLSQFVVAPVIALAALCVASGLAIFRYGSPD
jgi:hypothetical protein